MARLEITHRRMRHSRVVGRGFASPAAAVAWHGAIQAQDYAGAKWSVGQRVGAAGEGDVDRALTEGTIVRTHVLRPTWHFVARDDIRWILELTAPAVLRKIRRRYEQLDLHPRVLARCSSVIAAALEENGRLPRALLGRLLQGRGIDTSMPRLSFILMHCELDGLICSGGLDGNQQTHALLDQRVPPSPPRDRESAVAELVERYLQSHGPATARDLRWWSSLSAADVDAALGALASKLTREVVDGMTLWSLRPETARGRARGVHLVQAFDELLVGYTESRLAGDPRADAARASWTDPTLPGGILLLDGSVAGHWSRTMTTASLRLEVRLYEPGTPTAEAVAAAGEALGRFFRRGVTVASAAV